jgi:hypothetical protein
MSVVTASVVTVGGAGVGLAVVGPTGAFSNDPGADSREPTPRPPEQVSRSAACSDGAHALASTLSQRSPTYRKLSPTSGTVHQWICPDFNGDHRRDIAFTFGGGSGGAGVWAAFRAKPGRRWEKVYESPGGLALRIRWRRPAIEIDGVHTACHWSPADSSGGRAISSRPIDDSGLPQPKSKHARRRGGILGGRCHRRTSSCFDGCLKSSTTKATSTG